MKNHAEQKTDEIFGLQKQGEQHYKDYCTAEKQIKSTLASLEEQRQKADDEMTAAVKTVMLTGCGTTHLSELIQQSELSQKTFDTFTEKSKTIKDRLLIERSNCVRKAKSEANILALTVCDRTKVFDVETAEMVLEKVGSFMEGNYHGTLTDKLDKMKALAEAA